MFYTFISNLKTVDIKKLSIELLENKAKQFNDKLKEVKGNSKRENDITENINDFVICISNLYFVINEVDKGIRYFQKKLYIEI